MYSLEYLSAETFATICDEWQELLFRSNVDPLFMSWYWQFSWWEQWGESVEAELRLIAVKLDGRLVALMPLYRCRSRVKPFNIYRLQFIGNNWGQKSTVRSEYLQAIIDIDYVEEIQALLVSELLKQSDWDDFVLCDYPEQEGISVTFLEQLKKQGIKPARQYREHGYSIDVSDNYTDYISKLGKNTRLKLHNRRNLAEKITGTFYYQPNVKCDDYAVDTFFNHLNSFHCTRWGKPAFDCEALSFHQSLIERLSFDRQYSTSLSVLSDQGEVKSVLYDLAVDGRCYNIQSGYQENWHKKISLGTLHLGYVIESLCSSGAESYDLLLGCGKTTDYKSQLGTKKVNANTWIYSRRMNIRLIHKAKYYIGWCLSNFKN